MVYLAEESTERQESPMTVPFCHVAYLSRSATLPVIDWNHQCPSRSAALPVIASFFALAPFTPGLGAYKKVCLLNSGSQAKALNT